MANQQIETARDTYSIDNWSDGYFDINTEGQIDVGTGPDAGRVGLDLLQALGTDHREVRYAVSGPPLAQGLEGLELRLGGRDDHCVEGGRGDAELGEETGDAIEVVELAPAGRREDGEDPLATHEEPVLRAQLAWPDRVLDRSDRLHDDDDVAVPA